MQRRVEARLETENIDPDFWEVTLKRYKDAYANGQTPVFDSLPDWAKDELDDASIECKDWKSKACQASDWSSHKRGCGKTNVFLDPKPVSEGEPLMLAISNPTSRPDVYQQITHWQFIYRPLVEWLTLQAFYHNPDLSPRDYMVQIFLLEEKTPDDVPYLLPTIFELFRKYPKKDPKITESQTQSFIYSIKMFRMGDNVHGHVVSFAFHSPASWRDDLVAKDVVSDGWYGIVRGTCLSGAKTCRSACLHANLLIYAERLMKKQSPIAVDLFRDCIVGEWEAFGSDLALPGTGRRLMAQTRMIWDNMFGTASIWQTMEKSGQLRQILDNCWEPPDYQGSSAIVKLGKQEVEHSQDLEFAPATK